MKKSIIIILLGLTLSGCGAFDRRIAAITGDASSVCVGGVEYLQFTSGVSVAYTEEGKIRKCK